MAQQSCRGGVHDLLGDRDTYVLASSEKIGTASQFTVLPLAEVAGIITDASVDNPTVARLRALGVTLVTA
jgi:DeoR/GlpR family transcriptional regulator of sugar metabolism